MINLKYSAALLLVGSSMAWAGAPTSGIAIDTGSLGIDKSIQVNSYVTPTSETVDGGGEFSGTLTGTPATGSGTVGFWCVDDQEAFYFGQSGLANVFLLSDTATIDSASTHYGTLTNTSTPHWTNNTGILASATTADDRYTLAAYLISQYSGFDTNITPTAEDNAIQEAIWAITNTTTPVGGPIYEAGYSDLNGTTGIDSHDSVSYWVNQALANAGTTVNTSDWAVVSWGANAVGVLNDGPYNDGANATNQTFLVELGSTTTTTHNNFTPEPGFYGVLALGLSGLFFAARRRKKA